MSNVFCLVNAVKPSARLMERRWIKAGEVINLGPKVTLSVDDSLEDGEVEIDFVLNLPHGATHLTIAEEWDLNPYSPLTVLARAVQFADNGDLARVLVEFQFRQKQDESREG